MVLPAFCVVVFTVHTARAGAREAISLSADGSQAEVTLEVPEEMVQQKEDVVSLQLSFQIEAAQGTLGEKDVSFDFGGQIGSAVKEQRYDPDSKVLSIYISGNQDLYEKESLSLGKIVINSSSERGVTATVRVVPGSMKTINRAHGIRESGVHAPDTVSLVSGGGGTSPPDTLEPPQYPENSEENGNARPAQPGEVVENDRGNVSLEMKNPEGGGLSRGFPSIGDTLSSWTPKPAAGGSVGETQGFAPEEFQEEKAGEQIGGAAGWMWMPKLPSMDSDAWIRVFVGVIIAAALVMAGILAALLAGPPKKRRKRRRKRQCGRSRAQRRRRRRRRIQKIA